jgi:hypothetical protein
MSRNLSEAKKKHVAGKQYFKCANEPNKHINGIYNYKCPLWQINGNKQGSFDESGYEIDHIVEYCLTNNDSFDNLQALCKMCHAVKTKSFLMNDKRIKNKNNNRHMVDNIDDNDDDIIVVKKKVHKMVVYKCEKCDEVFKRKTGITYHTTNNVCEKGEYSCKFCKKCFPLATACIDT